MPITKIVTCIEYPLPYVQPHLFPCHSYHHDHLSERSGSGGPAKLPGPRVQTTVSLTSILRRPPATLELTSDFGLRAVRWRDGLLLWETTPRGSSCLHCHFALIRSIMFPLLNSFFSVPAPHLLSSVHSFRRYICSSFILSLLDFEAKRAY